METKRSKVVIAAGLLIMSLTMACNSALAPILAEVGKSFPEAGDANIQIVLTLINLITLPMMLLEPRLERFMTKRDVAILGTFFMLVGGLLPQFLNTELWMLYVASVVIGTGLSLVVVTSSSLISDYFTGIDKSRIMGYQSIFVSIGGTIIAKGSGSFTAAWGWEKGYLVFLIAVPIIIAIFSMVPKGKVVPPVSEGQSGIDRRMVYFGLLCLVTGIFVAIFNTNLAMYLDRKGIGDAATAGTVASIMQVWAWWSRPSSASPSAWLSCSWAQLPSWWAPAPAFP